MGSVRWVGWRAPDDLGRTGLDRQGPSPVGCDEGVHMTASGSGSEGDGSAVRSIGGSSFGLAGTPSSASIGAALRTVAPDASVELGEQTVAHLCERLGQAAAYLGDLALLDQGEDRAEAFRYLSMMLAFSVDAAVLGNDPLRPMFTAPYQSHRNDWGAASPDGVYRRSWVSDRHTYRVHGRLGNADYFFLEFRRASPPAGIRRDEIPTGPDGSFDIVVGGPERDGDWFAMPEGTVGITVREFFGDWLGAQRSHLRIECLDAGDEPAPLLHPARVQAELDLSADWILGGAIEFWADRSTRLLAEIPNQFVRALGRTETKLPVTTHGTWDLADDEALVIELPDPHATFWAFQLASSLWHTLDYAHHLTSANMVQTHRDDDGVHRLVLSRQDPGVHNWLDTTGLRRGVVILRQIDAAQPQVPTTRVVPVADVAQVLAGTRTCDPSQRRAQLAERREGVAHLVCD
jgi:hypothetical protein